VLIGLAPSGHEATVFGDVIGLIKYKDGTSENINQKLLKEDGKWKLSE